MSHQLARLQAKHQRILELVLDGWRTKDIAQELDLTPVGVGNVVNSPVFQHELSRRRAERDGKLDEAQAVRSTSAREILASRAVDAAETLTGLLSSDDEKIQQSTAMDILDRTGTPRISRSESMNLEAQVILDADALERISRAARESGSQMPELVVREVEPTPEMLHDQAEPKVDELQPAEDDPEQNTLESVQGPGRSAAEILGE